MAELELIPIGRLTKTHALKGALKMRPFNVNTEFFKYTDTIYLKNGKGYKIIKIQPQNGIFILTLGGINTIETAQELKGNEVFIDKSLIPIAEDEILLSDMIGFKVIFKDKIIGEIFDFADYNAGFIYLVKNDKNENYYLPDRDEFIEKIDYDKGEIFFKNIEELLE